MLRWFCVALHLLVEADAARRDAPTFRTCTRGPVRRPCMLRPASRKRGVGRIPVFRHSASSGHRSKSYCLSRNALRAVGRSATIAGPTYRDKVGYLKSEDLEGVLSVTIKAVQKEEIGQARD